MIELRDDRYCFACGGENPIGLKLSFHWDGDTLKASFIPSREHQGYKDVVHGGIISTVLDECMAQAAIKKLGAMAATVEMRVKFRQALRAGEESVAEAGTKQARHGIVEAWSTLKRASDGALLAEATAKLMMA